MQFSEIAKPNVCEMCISSARSLIGHHTEVFVSPSLHGIFLQLGCVKVSLRAVVDKHSVTTDGDEEVCLGGPAVHPRWLSEALMTLDDSLWLFRMAPMP